VEQIRPTLSLIWTKMLWRPQHKSSFILGRGLNRHAVYKVTDIVLLPLEPSSGSNLPLVNQLGLKPCPKHHGGL